MPSSTTRRHFIGLACMGGAALLAACSRAPDPAPAPPAPSNPVIPTSDPVVPVSPASTPAPASAPASSTVSGGASMVMVDEKDAQPASLGFVTDSARADATRFKAYVVGRQCSGCMLYTGQIGTGKGACAIFQGRVVPAQGWCSAWVQRV